jgi:hypothetical protein
MKTKKVSKSSKKAKELKKAILEKLVKGGSKNAFLNKHFEVLA